MSKKSQKHKTVGVSFHPGLQKRAGGRSQALGLSFSRYVTLCVEAELAGHVAQLIPDEGIDLEKAIVRARHYMEAKTQSIEFENDIEETLAAEGIPFTRFEKSGPLLTDFMVRLPLPERKKELKIALDCRYNIRNNATVALGQTILLKSEPDLDAVILVIPYLKNFDPRLLETFRQQEILITTPDKVLQTLRKLSKRFGQATS